MEKKEFKLGAEDARALDFDDVVAFCKDLEPTEEDPREYHTDFFQMKYTCNENEKITYKDLRKPIDDKNLNKFSLAKYFLTFLRIRSDQRFSPYSLGKFVVCTNIDFDHALKDYIEQNRNGSYSLRFSEQLHQKFILIFEDELREKVLQNKKLHGKNPYSSIDAREEDGRIVIYESTLRGETGQSIEELMKKFFRDLRFLTGVRIDDCEQHTEQIIQKAIESPENEYISENLVPRATHYIEKWFCSGSSDSFLTNEEAQAFLKKLKKDFFDIFRSNNLVISTNACPQPAQPVEIGAVPLPFGNKYTTTTHICWQHNSVQPGTISLPPLSPGYQYTTVTNVFWHLFPYGYQYTTTINICWQHVDQIIQSGAIPLPYGYQYTTTTNICWQPATHLIQTGTIFPSPPPGYKYTTTTNTCWQSIDQLVQPGTTALSPGYQYTTTINICRQPIEQPVQPGTTFLPPLSPGYQYTIATHVDQQPSTQLSNTASQPIQQGFLVHR